MNMTKQSRRRAFRTGAGLFTLAAGIAAPAFSQAAPSPAAKGQAVTDTRTADARGAPDVAEIVVTASRLKAAGFVAPTPTTVVGVADMTRTGATNIGEVVNTIPAFRASATPTAGTIGSSYPGSTFLDLRSLGATRTLVLVDGHRFVPTTNTQTIDINLIPSQLVERTDVVTGGASAAWGSDAVAGVVNLVLKKNIQGIQGSVQYGLAERGDGQEANASVAGGTGFAGGRGHITLAAEATQNLGVGSYSSRKWIYNQSMLIANPLYTPTNGQPQRLWISPVHVSNATENGLILNGPRAGTEFTPGGGTRTFTYGSPLGTGFMVGGDGVNLTPQLQLSTPFKRVSTFNTLTFDVTPDVHLSVQGSFSRSEANSQSTQSYSQAPYAIRNDNAFLPAGLCTGAAGATCFNLGRINTDLGYISPHIVSKTYRVVSALDGTLGGSWKWNAYYEWGQTDYRQQIFNNLLSGQPTSNFFLAVDAVRNAAGQIVCRSTLTNPNNGCVPINLFGYGAPSAAAKAYVNGTMDQNQRIREDAAGATINGEPFSTWAGPVAIAFGAEYRRDSVANQVDGNSLTSQFFLGNPKPINGHVTVKEGFGEIGVPLARDIPFMKSFDLNAAARITDYSTSGRVTTWKVGATWDLTTGLRLRATRSRDIRAANLNELFSGSTQRVAGLTDVSNGSNVSVPSFLLGNPNLQPEKADTTTAGIVLQPTFAPGLRLSVDAYRIKINGAIQTLAAQDELDRCNAGAVDLCQFIIRAPSTNSLPGLITSISTPYVNLASIMTRGLDFEAIYSLPLTRVTTAIPGTMTFRVLATYVDTLKTNDGRVVVDRAGQDNGTAVPHWQGTAIVGYTGGPLTLSATGRYIGGGKYDTTYFVGSGPNSINRNHIEGRFYLNLSGQVDISGDGRMRLFAVVNNVMDRDPPVVPGTLINGGVTNSSLFDVLGRSFRIGARFRF